MSPAARIGGFAAALAVLFGAAVAIGSAVGPTHRADRAQAEGHAMGAAGDLPQGLAVAAHGFRLIASTAGFAAGERRDLTFRIADAGGETVRDFDVEHAKRMHVIVVRRDLTRYAHVHPEQRPDGSWSVPLTLPDPGTYRVFADFTASGADRVTLGTDLVVPGAVGEQPLPAPVRSVSVDGYDVALAAGAGELAFTVTRAGRPVTVEPYLGADGHLVTLRQGDLAYLHAHPVEHESAGGPIRFMVDYPSAGRYRLFLQFQHEGVVHTAAFTQEVR
ncbi:MAG: hypothetical protein ACJ762_14925 [Solirubrobacteraceae bacterium]